MMRSMVAAMIAIAVPAVAAGDPQAAISAAMADSAAGWNSGDLTRFVAIYAEDATFVTPQGLLRSKAAIADHYRPSFADGRNRRGKLSFRPLGWRALSPVHQILFARWILTPDGDGKADQGMTTLVFERRPQGWRIISDHSS